MATWVDIPCIYVNMSIRLHLLTDMIINIHVLAIKFNKASFGLNLGMWFGKKAVSSSLRPQDAA